MTRIQFKIKNKGWFWISKDNNRKDLNDLHEFSLDEESSYDFWIEAKDIYLNMKEMDNKANEIILKEVEEIKIQNRETNEFYHLKLNPHLLNLGIKKFYLESTTNA